METKQCVLSRRSIRRFKKSQISDEKIKSLIEYALYAPSANNCQNWEFVVVKNDEMKKKLSQVQKYCSFINDAPVTIVVCYDKTKSADQIFGLLSIAIAAENLLLGIANEGLGACWCYVKNDNDPEIEEKVKKYLELPENIGVLCMIPVGEPDKEPSAKIVKDMNEVVHFDKW